MSDTSVLKDIIKRGNPIKLESLVNQAYKKGISIRSAYQALKEMINSDSIVEYKGGSGTYYIA